MTAPKPGQVLEQLEWSIGHGNRGSKTLKALQDAAAQIRQQAAQLAEAEAREARLREKAELWDGLMGLARLRTLGFAGMDETGAPEPTDYYGNPSNGYAHLGIELWTKVGAGDFEIEGVAVNHERTKNLITGIVRISQALKGATP